MKKYRVSFIVFNIILMHCFIKTEAPEVALQSAQKYGVYDIIGRAIAPLKSVYGYSKEEKIKARLEIARLEIEKVKVKEQYQKNLSESFGSYHEQLIKDQFKKKMADLDNQIYQQRIITGEVMSTKRKLVLTGMGVAAVTIGGIILYKYFIKEPQKLDKTKVKIKEKPIEKIKEATVIETKEKPIEIKKEPPKREPVVEPKKEPVKKFEFSPYQSPPLVDNPYDLAALENRLERILQQKEVSNEKGLLVQSPNYNVIDERMAKEAVENAKQLIKDFPYSYISPPLVEYEDDIKGHQKRLELIREQRSTKVGGFLRKNPRYNIEDEYFEKNALRKAQAIYDQATFKIPPIVTDALDIEDHIKRYNSIKDQEDFKLYFNNQVELVRNPFYDPGVAQRALEDVERSKRKLEKVKKAFEKFDEERKKEEELKKREKEEKEREEEFKRRVQRRKERMRRGGVPEWMVR